MIRKQRYRNDYIIIIISGPLWSVSDRYGLLGKVDGDFSHTERKKTATGKNGNRKNDIGKMATKSQFDWSHHRR